MALLFYVLLANEKTTTKTNLPVIQKDTITIRYNLAS